MVFLTRYQSNGKWWRFSFLCYGKWWKSLRHQCQKKLVVCQLSVPLTALIILTRCCRLLFVGCLMSQQHASVSQGRICSGNFTCCHTEIEATDQTFHLTQSQYTDTGPTSPSTDPIIPGAWQGSQWSANFKSLVWLDPGNISTQAEFEPGIFRSRGGRLNH